MEEDITDIEFDSISVCSTSVSNSDAMKMFDGCITWLQQQKDTYHYLYFMDYESWAAK